MGYTPELDKYLPKPVDPSNQGEFFLTGALSREQLGSCHLISTDFLDIFYSMVSRVLYEQVVRPHLHAYSLSEFKTLQTKLLSEYLSLKRRSLNGDVWRSDSLRSAVVYSTFILGYLGFMVGSEFGFIENQDVSGNKRPSKKKIIEHLQTPTPSTLSPNQKILPTLDAATKLIHKLRFEEGNRTVIVYGGFDWGTVAHSEILNHSAKIAGKFGKIIVVVASDEEMKFTRGDTRPHDHQDRRCLAVASNAYVHHVLPLSLPQEVTSPSQLREYYAGIQQQLPAHIRFVGEKDDPRFDTFLQQSIDAGTLLVYDELPRTSSATKQISSHLESKI